MALLTCIQQNLHQELATNHAQHSIRHWVTCRRTQHKHCLSDCAARAALRECQAAAACAEKARHTLVGWSLVCCTLCAPTAAAAAVERMSHAPPILNTAKLHATLRVKNTICGPAAEGQCARTDTHTQGRLPAASKWTRH